MSSKVVCQNQPFESNQLRTNVMVIFDLHHGQYIVMEIMLIITLIMTLNIDLASLVAHAFANSDHAC